MRITDSAVAQRCVKLTATLQVNFDSYRIESIEVITNIFGTGD